MSRGPDRSIRNILAPLQISEKPHRIPLAIFFAACASVLPSAAHAQSASTWNSRGTAAALKEDYDAAYEDYLKAHNKKPADLRYKTRLETMRFQAAVQHIDRGRVLRASGDYTGALQNFMRAMEIDPGNQTAQQEIRITQQQQPAPTPAGPGAAAAQEQVAHQDSVLQNIADIAGPVVLKPVSNDPITLHMVEDTKIIYQAIGKLAGLNVLFDPEYTAKRIPIDLTNVTLSDALRIVGTLSGTFYKPVTSNTIFVAQNTRTKRTDLDEQAVQTFYLANSSQANDGNEILTGLRLLLDPSVKLYLVPSQNAIVMRGTTDELLLAQKLINDFDRARPEVTVDVAVLEVNRDKLRDLGITLPQSIGLTPQLSNLNTTTSTTASTSTATTGTASTTTSSLTLNNLAHLNATNFAVSITGGTLNALLTDSDTRILQNPRIRATDGQRATLKIGEKIPVATGSYNAGVSTGIASIGVQTQFTYLDVGVNIDMTPTVHYDREVTLKMKIEVSSQDGSSTISGVTEPIIAQRVIDQVIQLQEGEPSILAGIITHQDNYIVSGTPGLGEIPFFKFFFSSQSKEVVQDEIVFLLIPHIVRESVLSRLNTEAIDTGTGSDIELRRASTPQPIPPAGVDFSEASPNSAGSPTTVSNAATAALQQLHEQAQPPSPTTHLPMPLPARPAPASPLAPSTAAPPAGTPISFTILPPAGPQKAGATFQTTILATGAHDVAQIPIQLQFDPKVLELVNVDTGTLLAQDSKPVALAHRDDNGTVIISASRPPGVNGVNGQGSVCVLTFRAIAPGDSALSLTRVGAKDSLGNNLPATGSNASIHVQ